MLLAAVIFCAVPASVSAADGYTLVSTKGTAIQYPYDDLYYPYALPCRAVVHGDAISPSIAAASILAKVSRDRHMEELDSLYPQYQFARHKGYGTKIHYQALDTYGPSPVHRRSFLKKWEAGR